MHPSAHLKMALTRECGGATMVTVQVRQLGRRDGESTNRVATLSHSDRKNQRRHV